MESDIDIYSEILALLESLNCAYTIDDGIVTVTTPFNHKWNFTVPERLC